MGAQARYAHALQAVHALVRRSLALRSSLIRCRRRDLHGDRLPAKAAAANTVDSKSTCVMLPAYADVSAVQIMHDITAWRETHLTRNTRALSRRMSCSLRMCSRCALLWRAAVPSASCRLSAVGCCSRVRFLLFSLVLLALGYVALASSTFAALYPVQS